MNALAGKTVLITRAQHQAETNECSSERKERNSEIPLLRMEGMSHKANSTY